MRPNLQVALIAILCALVVVAVTGLSMSRADATPTEPISPTHPTETPVSGEARGTFEVDLNPQSLTHEEAPATLGRMSIDKTFQGDLDGSSHGEMLYARTEVEGSAGYVAIERVTGTLAGWSGSFVFQHSSTMDAGSPTQSVTVVPDSGTGELAGLRGEMEIIIDESGHSYVFRYELPAAE